MKNMSVPQNLRVNWIDEPTLNSGFGCRRPALLACASVNKPSKKCGSCAHTLACASMTVYAYRCPRCGVRALWIEEINQWVWPEEPECAHEFIHTAELCWRCQANMDALSSKMRERPETGRMYTCTTTNGTTADPYSPHTVTTTGANPYVDSVTSGSKNIQWK